jgi:hypothetical protein
MNRTRVSSRLVAEFVLIVVSILSAFAVEDFRDERARRTQRATALSNIRAEIASNISALDGVMEYHQEIAALTDQFLADRTNWEGRRGIRLVGEIAPRGVLSPELRRTAWETAQVTGVVALLEYELGEQIAQVYASQGQGVEASVTRMIDHILSRAMFGSDETEAVLMLLGAMAGELFAQEQHLRGILDALLREIPQRPPG